MTRVDDAINRLSKCTPITVEDRDAFDCAVDCMNFTNDFMPLCTDPEKMKHAINLLNSIEYAIADAETKNENYINGATEFANRLKNWFVEHSNYWFSHTVNAEIDDLLEQMVNEYQE